MNFNCMGVTGHTGWAPRWLGRFCLPVFILLSGAVPGFPQDTLQIAPPSDSNLIRSRQGTTEKGAYWKPDHFRNIPVEAPIAQADSGKLRFEKISSKYDGPEFNYSEESRDRLTWWQRLKRRVTAFLESIFPDWSLPATTLALRILAVLGIVVLIGVVYRAVRSGKGVFIRERREQGASNTPDDIERNLETIDIQSYLEKALKRKEYSLAIRYLHLINLRAMADQDIISWDFRKTNQDFLAEIKDPALQSGFERTSRVYEYIWFGDFPIDERQFLEYRELFVHFKTSCG